MCEYLTHLDELFTSFNQNTDAGTASLCSPCDSCVLLSQPFVIFHCNSLLHF